MRGGEDEEVKEKFFLHRITSAQSAEEMDAVLMCLRISAKINQPVTEYERKRNRSWLSLDSKWKNEWVVMHINRAALLKVHDKEVYVWVCVVSALPLMQ